MKEKGVLLVISGFSGAGKGTIVKEILKEKSEDIALSISMTTRKPRNGEVDGKDYFFKTREEFEKAILDGELLEHAQYVGNYYGTPKKYVEEQLEMGKDVILEIDSQGALSVKDKFPEAVLIFITTKDAITLKNRLIGRGTESEDIVNQRLEQAKGEVKLIDKYDYLLVNDDLKKCIDEVYQIIKAAHHGTNENEKFIEFLINDFKTL